MKNGVFPYSFTRGRHGNPREHMSMQRRNTPPPAVSISSNAVSILKVVFLLLPVSIVELEY